MKKLIFGKDAREKLVKGVEIMYHAVATTLGPKGRNVAITYPWGNTIVVHDGVTVARDVEDKDEFVNQGIQLIREAAQKTNSEAGDGTTTSTLLAYHLVDKGMKLLDDGINPMILRKQMEEALPLLLAEIKKIATPVKSKAEIERVAFISSADEEIGNLVAEAVDKVGKEGLVTVEEGSSGPTVVEYTNGMEFNRGWSSQFFITSIERMESVISNPVIIFFDKKLTTISEILPILNSLVRKGEKDIVIIGEISGMALQTLIDNKMHGTINVLAVNPPGSAIKQEMMSDMALFTGAQIITSPNGVLIGDEKTPEGKYLYSVNPLFLGRAEAVVARRDSTTIVNGGGDKEVLNNRVAQLRELKGNERNPFEKEKIEERLAKLTTGAAIIRVGAKTDVEMREKIERVKDAVGAAKAALDEGIVPGGGTAFLRLASAMEHRNMGDELLYEVLKEPLNKLLINAGEDEDSQEKILNTIAASKGLNVGYNVNTGVVEDLIKAGVIDPAKVIRLSLENAISVAGSILTTDVQIVEEREVKKND